MKLFTYGSNLGSQLGEVTERDDDHIPCAHPFFDGKTIDKLACGIMHTLVLMDGKVYSWGCDDEFALGRQGNEHETLQVVIRERVIDICAGVSHSACLTETGHVYAWGTFRNDWGVIGFRPGVKFQKKPKQIEKNIMAITSCDNHIAMVKNTGTVLGYGPNLIKSNNKNKKSQTVLRSRVVMRGNKKRPRLEKIFSGADHCLGLSEGKVFAWGNNSNGQFGDGTEVSSYDLVETGMVEVDEAGAGSIHSVFLRKGDVYVCGKNEFHQLGNELKNTSVPVKLIDGVSMIAAKASGNVIVKDNSLYTWGSNFSGELGFPQGDVVAPKKIDFDFGEILTVGLGNDHCVVISK